MGTVLELPALTIHHRRHARALTALMAMVISGKPVEGQQAIECKRFIEASCRAINDDPSICAKIEEAAQGIR